MADYNSMYLTLFNAVTDAVNILQTAQAAAEEKYIGHEPANIKLLKSDTDKDGDNNA